MFGGNAPPLNANIMRISNFSALLLTAAAVAAGEQTFTAAFPAKGAFVLPVDAAPRALNQCSRRAPQGVSDFWVPSEAQIAELESRLVPYLDRRQRDGGTVPPNKAYHRQYIGIIRRSVRLIYGSFYLDDGFPGDDISEKSRAVIVCDGGSSFWGIEYDPATKAFDELQFNGYV